MNNTTSKFDAICEDVMMMSANKNYGMGTSELNPQKVNLLDILTTYKKSKKQKNNNQTSSPYPLQIDPMINHLGDLYLSAHQLGSNIRSANNNPIISDNDDYTKSIEKCVKGVQLIQKTLKNIADELGTIN